MSNHRNRGNLTKNRDLPAIPEKLYFTIGEVAKLCELKPHVLRYWEQEFPSLSPSKRRGNRRYYQRKDVLMIRQIKSLLYEQGYTIEGARNHMAEEAGGSVAPAASNASSRDAIQRAINGLEKISDDLEDES